MTLLLHYRYKVREWDVRREYLEYKVITLYLLFILFIHFMCYIIYYSLLLLSFYPFMLPLITYTYTHVYTYNFKIYPTGLFRSDVTFFFTRFGTSSTPSFRVLIDSFPVQDPFLLSFTFPGLCLRTDHINFLQFFDYTNFVSLTHFLIIL